jgi:hypothetical protein
MQEVLGLLLVDLKDKRAPADAPDFDRFGA